VGRGLVSIEQGFAFWHQASQTLEFIADPEADRPENRFNDGAVDRQGRFWAGTLGPEAACALYRLDADLSVHTMQTGITISNGIGWSPDQRTMYYQAPGRKTIYAYDFDRPQVA
jgi:sugar lactone lactonase YvrE